MEEPPAAPSNTSSSSSRIHTCQFIKGNGERCKRNVAVGEDKCWQHAHGWKHKLRSLTKNQTILFLLALLGIPGLWLSYDSWNHGRSHSMTETSIAKEVVKELPQLPRQHDVEKEIPEKLKTRDEVTAKKGASKVADTKPDVGMEFVWPENVAFRIVNLSDSVAR